MADQPEQPQDNPNQADPQDAQQIPEEVEQQDEVVVENDSDTTSERELQVLPREQEERAEQPLQEGPQVERPEAQFEIHSLPGREGGDIREPLQGEQGERTSLDDRMLVTSFGNRSNDPRPPIRRTSDGTSEFDEPSRSSAAARSLLREIMPDDDSISTSGRDVLRRSRTSRKSILHDVSRRRSNVEFVQTAIEQTLARDRNGILPDVKFEEVYTREEDVEDNKRDVVERDGTICLNGTLLSLARTPQPEDQLGRVRMWDKTQRHELTPEARLAFLKAATGFVLPKGNKLSLPKSNPSGDQMLAHVENLNHQVKTLQEHFFTYDIGDTFTIMIPISVQSVINIEREKFNLFEDYSVLHPSHVANSNAWYKTWVKNEYIQEDMAITYRTLQNNCDEDLWATCRELYDDFRPVQQGGPLMLILLLQRIQNQSEQALDHLKKQVEELKLNKIEGEDVEQVIRLIKSTYRVLKNSSTKTRSYVPLEFTKTVFQIFQTSTVSQFNDIFYTWEQEILIKADLKGVKPVWPSLSEVIRLAKNSYSRLKSAGLWDDPKKSAKGYTAQLTPNRPQSSTPRKLLCWNCGSDNHLLNDCTVKRNQDKIDEARRKFRAMRRPKHKTSADGKPLIRNKNGAYVLDSKKVKNKTAKSKSDNKTESTNPNETGDVKSSANVAHRADAIRSALRRSTPE